jgi:5-methylthioadenosine/S-adenosylhomocysteine deaminase
MLKTYALAQAWDAGLQMHVSETQDEVQMSLDAVGMRPIEWLAGLGLLGPHMQLVHSVWLSEREMELIADSASVVVHCPVSNMFLASGVSPIADLWARGVPVALATDGQACNNGQEMIEMPRAALNLQKVATLDATVLKPADVLHMASRGGAAAFGQRATLGSLEPGKKADLTLVSLVDTRFLPGMERQSALVNFAAKQDVDSVMVDGEFVMRAGQILTLEVESILEEARRARIDLLRRAGIETH